MPLTPGARVGFYEIRARLGVGGMGEVYRARDTKLNRDVAIKALPPSFVHDPERVARFRREAQLLASLNHPHIGAIYGLEEVEGRQLLVLELVEGGTLADRISKGALPVSESLAIAQQIAEALEAAHERGIIHRDLKPANIALTADDRVKVLDFGLAKATAPTESGPHGDVSDSPTLTMGATQAGVILGTAAYMSPEQAKGRVADQRSDVWAFGCVLFEMLAGKRAFEGDDASDTLAAVLRAEPDWSLLPRDVSDAIRVLLKRCLLKDRHARVANLGVARFVMTEATIAHAEPRPLAAPPVVQSGVRRPAVMLVAVAALVAGAALALGVGRFIQAGTPPAARAGVSRFSVSPPAAYALSVGAQPDRVLAISPDGTQLAFRGTDATGQSMIFVRNLNELEAQPLVGTAGGRQPFYSPDGRWIGYFTYDTLMKIAVTGGVPVELYRLPFSLAPAGSTWGDDGTIIFAMRQRGIGPGTPGLQRVPDVGGEVTTLTTPAVDRGELAHTSPVALPGGNAVLFTSAGSGGGQGAASASIVRLDLKTKQQTVLLQGGANPMFVSPGHIVFVGTTGTLQAVRFDVARGELVGEPVQLAEQIAASLAGEPQVSLSRTGTLVFLPADEGTRNAEVRSLLWVDRAGREEPIPTPARAFAIARLSPDGSRIALDARDQGTDIWIWDFARQSLARLTNDPTLDMMPIWTPDSRRVVWTSNRASPNPNLFWQAADGTGRAERASESPHAQFPNSVSPDGQHLVFFDAPRQSVTDLHRLTLAGDRARTVLLESGVLKGNGDVSPDGRWLAYESNESGAFEIYVRPFPKVESGRWQVSSHGGTRPVWSKTGTELFYLNEKDQLTSVAVKPSTDVFVSGAPAAILERSYYPGFSTRGFNLRGYDVSADGRRFLMLKNPETGSAGDALAITVVVNWFEELTARLANR